jgi:hypothetical protein
LPPKANSIVCQTSIKLLDSLAVNALHHPTGGAYEKFSIIVKLQFPKTFKQTPT